MAMHDETKLFYSPGSCSLASHILLEELGMPFTALRISIAAGEHRTPDYLSINPAGRVPALARGDWILTETPAILRHLCDTAPDAGLWPSDARESARCAEWIAWIQSSLDVAVSQVSRTARYVDDGGEESVIASGKRKTLDCAAIIDRRFNSGGPWALGTHYSPVDAYLLVYWMASFRPSFRLDLGTLCPAWAEHAQRMFARPAVRRAMEREGLTSP
ncbi:glutathione S-transferase family protein [Xanthobacteraceae bacterium A53D]